VETGLDYRGARYYDSDIGRFLSLDPLAADFPSWSDYNYVMSNPIILVDANGKSPNPPKKVHYYNMERQEDGSYKAVYNHSKTNIVVKSDFAIARNSKNGMTVVIDKGDHGVATTTTNVYTYWDSKGNIKSQTVENKDVLSGMQPSNSANDDKEDVVNAVALFSTMAESSAGLTIMEGTTYTAKGVQLTESWVPSMSKVMKGAGVFGSAVSIADKGSRTYTAIMEDDYDEAADQATCAVGYTVGTTLMCMPTGVTQIVGGFIFLGTAVYDAFVTDN